MDETVLMRSWESACRRLARRINLGWWLQSWLPILLVASLCGCVAVLLVRTFQPQPLHLMAAVCGAGLLVTMVASWWLARRRFETPAAARVRLEDSLGLQSRLSAAAEGVVSWPQLPQTIQLPVQWRWQRVVANVAMSAGLLALSMIVPIAPAGQQARQVIEKPSAVTEVEQWLEKLKEKDAVDPKGIEDVEKKIEELIKRPQDQWYQHASLEAAEHLRDETGKALQELGSQLEQARGSINALSEAGAKAGEEARNGLSKQAADNLNGLRSGAMKAGGDLADQLKDIDPSAMKGMSKEQMQKLADRLKQNADALREALANAPKFDFKECPCKGDKPGEGEGDRPGKGGIQRGRGDAELTVKKDETQLGTKKTEDLAGMLDPERIAPGDLLGTSDGKQKVDPSAFKGPSAGGAATTGSGGSAIMQNTLIPAEREALKRYFK